MRYEIYVMAHQIYIGNQPPAEALRDLGRELRAVANEELTRTAYMIEAIADHVERLEDDDKEQDNEEILALEAQVNELEKSEGVLEDQLADLETRYDELQTEHNALLKKYEEESE